VEIILPQRIGDGVTSPTRARRFPLQLPLWFRASADEPWHRARTLTISATGLSFTARNKLPIGTRLDMRFVVGLKSASSEVACRGRIVRLQQADEDTRTRTYGATIESYRLHRH
jgi:hypothetical protein